jgi:hypothetical protein
VVAVGQEGQGRATARSSSVPPRPSRTPRCRAPPRSARAVAQAAGSTAEQVLAVARETGDLGLAAERLLGELPGARDSCRITPRLRSRGLYSPPPVVGDRAAPTPDHPTDHHACTTTLVEPRRGGAGLEPPLGGDCARGWRCWCPRFSAGGIDGSTAPMVGRTPRVRVSKQTFEAARSLLEPLMGFVAARGRLPRPHELKGSASLTERFGSIRAAFALVRRVTGAAQWQTIVAERRRDLLVYLALAAFRRRPAFSALPEELQYDIRDLFGTYKAACTAADELLFSAGNTEAVDLACRTATVGKLTPEALYAHSSTLAFLPPLLRVYEGCARALVGTVEEANVLKFNRRDARVSYLSYPGFERDPHPPLHNAVVASLSKLRVDFRDYRESANPPILHRKEALVATDHPLWGKFARLTAQEERLGLYADPTAIGTKAGWTEILAQAGVQLRGHRVLRAPPAIGK